MKFPKHEAGLSLHHNEHRTIYQDLAEFVDDCQEGYCRWESEEAKQRAIETDNMWYMHWYPVTPVGFICCAAPTLEELLAFASSFDEAK